MAILNKILSVAIFVLAVVTLVFSVKLYDQRELIIEQRELLVKALKNVGATTGYPITAKFTTEKNGENAITKETIAADEKAVVNAVKSLKDHRDALAVIITDIGKRLQLDQSVLSTEDLQGNDQEVVAKRAKIIMEAATAITKRDADIFETIRSWGELVEVSINVSHLKSTTEFKKPLQDVQAGIEALKEKSMVVSAGVKSAVEKMTAFEWSFSPDELNLADYKEAINKLISDMEKINEKLASVNKLEEELKAKGENIEELNKVIVGKDEDAKKLQSEISELKALNKELNDKLEEYQALNLDTSLIGTVTAVNKEFGFIIFNLGRKQVANDLEMYVVRGTEYVATIRVIGVQEKQSIAEILSEFNKSEVKIGDKVIFTVKK